MITVVAFLKVAHLNAAAMQAFKAQVGKLLDDLSVKVLQTV